jgi:hypothetical protein
MAENTINWLVKKCIHERFFFVLVALLSFLILSPLLKDFLGLRSFLNVFLTVVFISSIYAVSQKRHHLIISILLALPLLLSTWADNFIENSALPIVGTFSGILFFGFIVVIILSFVLKQAKVTLDVIYASIVVYLSLAMMWGMIFILVELMEPASLTLVKERESSFHFFYYSFVTITTLGYGDITPTTEIAPSLALLEAVIGQIYLVVLVARLVGIHIAQSMKEDSQ